MYPDGRSCLQADCSYCTVQFHLLTNMTAAKADTTHFFACTRSTLRCRQTHPQTDTCVCIQAYTLSEHSVSLSPPGHWVRCGLQPSKQPRQSGGRRLLPALKKRLTLRRDRVMVVTCAGWYKQLYVYE